MGKLLVAFFGFLLSITTHASDKQFRNTLNEAQTALEHQSSFFPEGSKKIRLALSLANEIFNQNESLVRQNEPLIESLSTSRQETAILRRYYTASQQRVTDLGSALLYQQEETEHLLNAQQHMHTRIQALEATQYYADEEIKRLRACLAATKRYHRHQFNQLSWKLEDIAAMFREEQCAP